MESLLLDSSMNRFFKSYPKIKEYFIIYDDDAPSHLFINHNQKNSHPQKKEFYDLTFEGDILVLRSRYPTFPIVKSSTFYRITENELNSHDVHFIRVVRDSVKVRLYGPGDVRGNETRAGFPARYKGNLDSLAQKIAKELRTDGYGYAIDSVLVYQARVERNGSFVKMSRIVGKVSPFSKILEKAFPLQQWFRPGPVDTAIWKAAIIYTSGAPISTNVRMYAKLNKDGTVTLKTSPRLIAYRDNYE
ncbi:hypothetical protein [Sphingobacterium suaedae]|uniref:Uncharacterized protein n=1 Tax=Sphingobacterium suaedae TaxID=1686402 RepID=A0ABW5KLB7_9SPHI